MAISQPNSSDNLNSPDHAKLHRVIGVDTSASDQSVVVDSLGKMGIGTSSPTAFLHLPAGTTANPPLKFESGTKLTTPESGSLEYDGKHLEFTPSGERRSVNFCDGTVLSDSTVYDTTTETTIYTVTLGADELHSDSLIRVWVSGYYDTASTNDSFTARLKVGGITVATLSSSTANITDGYWDIEFNFTVRSEGASGSIINAAKGNFDGEHNQQANQSETTIDTTSAQDITLTIQWNNAKTGNSLTITQGVTKFLN